MFKCLTSALPIPNPNPSDEDNTTPSSSVDNSADTLPSLVMEYIYSITAVGEEHSTQEYSKILYLLAIVFLAIPVILIMHYVLCDCKKSRRRESPPLSLTVTGRTKGKKKQRRRDALSLHLGVMGQHTKGGKNQVKGGESSSLNIGVMRHNKGKKIQRRVKHHLLNNAEKRCLTTIPEENEID